MWLYFNGFSLWMVGLTAVVGFALLLLIDWVVERRPSSDNPSYQG